MPDSNSANVARFLHQYKGIEGFYFLNKNGELGFIDQESRRAMKELFAQKDDSEFLQTHPEFKKELNAFKIDIKVIAETYLKGDNVSDIELGYLLPVSEGKTWLSSTLILHKNIIDTLECDDQLLYSKGIKDPVQIDQEAEKMKGIRSVQQGFDDLLHHRDAFGMYKYFPVLFKLPNTGIEVAESGTDKAPVRVLNLRWHKSTSERTRASDLVTHETVFSILRNNLMNRGAIDRNRRIQNKLQIS